MYFVVVIQIILIIKIHLFLSRIVKYEQKSLMKVLWYHLNLPFYKQWYTNKMHINVTSVLLTIHHTLREYSHSNMLYKNCLYNCAKRI